MTSEAAFLCRLPVVRFKMKKKLLFPFLFWSLFSLLAGFFRVLPGDPAKELLPFYVLKGNCPVSELQNFPRF